MSHHCKLIQLWSVYTRISFALTIVILAVLLNLVDALLPYLGVPIAGRAAVVLRPFSNTGPQKEEEGNEKIYNNEEHNSQKLSNHHP